MAYFKSPMNYQGNKYKLLSQILPLFPSDMRILVEPFCGGLDVSLNADVPLKICNDNEPHIIDLYSHLQGECGIEVHNQILEVISKYDLSKTNTEGYLKLREDYNKNPNWLLFYCLILHCFNNQVRFNKNGEFNLPHGKNRSSYNSKLQERLPIFVDRLDDSFVFSSLDFRALEFPQDTFVYADPPYLISLATYNEKSGWTKQDDIDLFNWLDELNSRGIKFGLSNVLEHKGKKNEELISWSQKYVTHYLNSSYKNCSYNKIDNTNCTIEVFICNY